MISSQVNNINTNWKNLIQQYDFTEIDRLYEKNSDNLYPPIHNIFRCFDYFNIEETKVVILGQDPYHREGQAIGLCFGVNPDIKIPPSFRNIKKELLEDLNIELSDTTLEKWAIQGTLLLNASLSVKEGSPASHMKIWSKFTQFIIQAIEDRCTDVIFVAWGAFAHKKMDNIKNNHLIVSSHPSPLSNKRPYKTYPPFSGSKPFSKINELLENEIIW